MRVIVCSLLFLFFTWGDLTPVYGQEIAETNDNVQFVKAKVLESRENGQNYLLTVEISSGLYKGHMLELPYIQVHPAYQIIMIRPGDDVLVQVESENNQITNAYISDYGRDRYLFYLTAAFVLSLILIGGKKGAKSLVSLLISGLAIFFVMLPMVFQGYNPIISTILISTAISIVTLFLVGGINNKTIAAIIGTTGGVLAAGILAIFFGSAAQLTGFSDEEMQSLLFISGTASYDYRGILFSGMIIGALGAVMDVGMSIASAIEEIKIANPSQGPFSLIRAGMNVGRDTMGTMANTLILAYTGGAIPLMLIFMVYQTPLLRIINLDLISTEIVRALTGSIGLIIAVPITSLTAGLLFGRVKMRRKNY